MKNFWKNRRSEVAMFLFSVMVLAAGMSFKLLTNLNHLSWILGISGPLFLIGILFLLDGLFKKEGGTRKVKLTSRESDDCGDRNKKENSNEPVFEKNHCRNVS